MKIKYCENDIDILRSFKEDLVPVCKCGAVMEQDYETDVWYCPDCDFEVEDFDEYTSYGPYAELLETTFLADPYDDTYDDDFDEPGLGCEACGNPAYPDCKTSCPLFDD